jgi:hypothetical protein
MTQGPGQAAPDATRVASAGPLNIVLENRHPTFQLLGIDPNVDGMGTSREFDFADVDRSAMSLNQIVDLTSSLALRLTGDHATWHREFDS